MSYKANTATLYITSASYRPLHIDVTNNIYSVAGRKAKPCATVDNFNIFSRN